MLQLRQRWGAWSVGCRGEGAAEQWRANTPTPISVVAFVGFLRSCIPHPHDWPSPIWLHIAPYSLPQGHSRNIRFFVRFLDSSQHVSRCNWSHKNWGKETPVDLHESLGAAKCTAFLFQLSGDNSLSPKHEPLKSIVLEVYRSNNVNELLRVHTAPDPSGYSSQKCVGEKRFGDF